MSKQHYLQFSERISSDNDPLDVYSLVCLSSESINMQIAMALVREVFFIAALHSLYLIFATCH